MSLEQAAPQFRQRVVGQPAAQHVRERAQDRPVLTRLSRRKRGARSHLYATFGIDENARFLRVSSPRQNDIRATGAMLAVSADIDDENARRDIDLVSPEQKHQVERIGRRHFANAKAAGRE